MNPHCFEHDGTDYEVRFERTPDGWIGRIRQLDSETVHVVSFPDGRGFDPDDVRGSLIAGCQAVIAQLPSRPSTRH